VEWLRLPRIWRAKEIDQGDVLEEEEWLEVVPEGVEAVVPYRGSVSDILHQLLGGLRSAMSYAGAATLPDLVTQAEFIRITVAGREESGVHDVSVL
jgi:IMP dehydrogenase